MRLFFKIPLLLFLLALGTELAFAQKRLLWRQALPAILREVSGMVRTPEGHLWMLNDSNNPPNLFRYAPCTRQLLEVRPLPVPNRDWEALTMAPDGTLYIGDFGNNLNNRRDLRIYRYHPQTEALDSILFSYPDQHAFPPLHRSEWNFDCEALIVWQDTLHLFSKAAFASECVVKHYTLPTKPGTYVAEWRDSLRLPKRVVTDAALSSDGQTLALVSYFVGRRWGVLPYARATVFFFRDFPQGYFLRGRLSRRHLSRFAFARQYEAITFWGKRCWLVANEKRLWQRQGIRVKTYDE